MMGANGAATFSWLYMPIILDAFNIEAFPFSRLMIQHLDLGDALFRGDMWSKWVNLYSAEFSRQGIMQEQIISAFDGNFHLPAKIQEKLLSYLPDLANDITLYGWALVQAFT